MDHPQPRGDEQQTDRAGCAEQTAPSGRAHERIRRSTGSRPIRIITR